MSRSSSHASPQSSSDYGDAHSHGNGSGRQSSGSGSEPEGDPFAHSYRSGGSLYERDRDEYPASDLSGSGQRSRSKGTSRSTKENDRENVEYGEPYENSLRDDAYGAKNDIEDTPLPRLRHSQEPGLRGGSTRAVKVAIAVIVLVALAALIAFIIGSCTNDESGADSSDDSAAQSTSDDTGSTLTSSGILSIGGDGVLTVAIDPGHGADDVGTEGYGLVESDLCWKIANYCVSYLNQYDNVKTVLTRSEDTNPTLEERAQTAADAGADVLISIHINENEDPSYSGCTVFFPTDQTSYLENTTTIPARALAHYVFLELTSIGLNGYDMMSVELYIDPSDSTQDKYAYPNDTSNVSDYYGIIRCSRALGIPAVLIEQAFLSNSGDAALLADDSFLQQMGEADARAILMAAGIPISN
jgi:N-acetylmuramoyl-L-alanine amidase